VPDLHSFFIARNKQPTGLEQAGVVGGNEGDDVLPEAADGRVDAEGLLGEEDGVDLLLFEEELELAGGHVDQQADLPAGGHLALVLVDVVDDDLLGDVLVLLAVEEDAVRVVGDGRGLAVLAFRGRFFEEDPDAQLAELAAVVVDAKEEELLAHTHARVHQHRRPPGVPVGVGRGEVVVAERHRLVLVLHIEAVPDVRRRARLRVVHFVHLLALQPPLDQLHHPLEPKIFGFLQQLSQRRFIAHYEFFIPQIIQYVSK